MIQSPGGNAGDNRNRRPARLVGNQDQHKCLSIRTTARLRRDKERNVKSLAEDMEGHFNANGMYPAYRTLKQLHSEPYSQFSAIPI